MGERVELRAGGARADGRGGEGLRLTRLLVNAHLDPTAVPAPSPAARDFHRSLPGYAPTPLHDLGSYSIKDETSRLGLPAFKILGASWAAECALREASDTHMLIAASAGNHGRAVARVAAQRGLACRVFLPERSTTARREAIASEGAEVVVVDGDYEDAVRLAAEAAREPGVLEIADVGDSVAAHAVIDGYGTLFEEIAEQARRPVDALLVPVGVGSLAAAAARFGAVHGIRVIGVEPAPAACLTASLAAGEPTPVATPGTTMAGMDCAEVSTAAWPSVKHGVAATVLVEDEEIPCATAALAEAGIHVGECGAAPLAALSKLGLDLSAHALLIATEGKV